MKSMDFLVLMPALNWVTIGIIVWTSIYFYFRNAYNFWKKKGIKFPKPVAPFGNYKKVILGNQSITDFFIEKYFEFEDEPYFGVYEVTRPTLIDRGVTIDEELDPLSAHLVNLSFPRWHTLRSKLSPVFTSGKLKLMLPLVLECVDHFKEALQEKLGNGNSVNMSELLVRYFTDVIGTCGFGLQFNAIKGEHSEFRTMVKRMVASNLENAMKRLFMTVCPIVLKLFRIKVTPGGVTNFFIHTVKEVIEHRQKYNVIRNDFVDQLVQLRKQGSMKSSKTLRKYPIASFVPRECTKDYNIPGTSHKINRGQIIQIPIAGLHYDPKFYANPEIFNPENFSSDAKASRPSCAYIPFGEGPRICIGLRFAFLGMKSVICTLITNFTFSTCEKTVIPMELDPRGFLSTPKTPIWLKVNKLK
ncbi:hypothetical protein C0J52_14304 [Blattella germanica]|nr:hypothetical protein C0J52_14304 [Blattella germanica]